MAAGNVRIIRYVLFTLFAIVLIYFISSSSIPKPPLPSGSDLAKWKGRKEAHQGVFKKVEDDPLEDSKEQLIVAPSSNRTPPGNSTTSPVGASVPKEGKMNATFVTLARNSDLWDIVESIRQIEDRFNRRYHYDWVFLNDKEFNEEFKKVTTTLISGTTKYGIIPKEHWSFPDWIDQDKAKKVREDMAERKIIYGDSVSYRHMCRFESGFFFRHPLLADYEWYWRVEPSIKVFCDVGFDPFRYMAENKKIYGFVISLYEYVETIPTIWESTQKFMKKFPEHIAPNNSMKWLSDDEGESYNHCHFWSNFEISNLNWLRSQAYLDFFETLDKDGGFFYERWGDAPVHSIAAGLMLNRDQIQFFDDIGYWHVPFTHCPTSESKRLDLKCTKRFFDMNDLGKPDGWQDQTD
ncbi:alpha-1,2-mannosyltransferase ktr1 [Bacidia gigantensis]|uniref:alpha-1,2-mannosyltransferase ktr1 n=1 Tax=Bacidia gigantensis TaxID=2732470 RepID=UPI001D037E33|nr:alpha-1,2-mannosyltransferase ktr1 [Bacidia gigantensis]KAG8527589.1 alpha-1,2-mannosyltransferase ktr1 [Bacidia gigantensis]